MHDDAITFEKRGIVASLANVQPAAQHHQQITAGERVIGPPVSVAPDHADAQRITVRHHVYGEKRIDNRNAERPDKLMEWGESVPGAAYWKLPQQTTAVVDTTSTNVQIVRNGLANATTPNATGPHATVNLVNNFSVPFYTSLGMG